MSNYLFVYEQGNGYHCGCCRRTETTTEVIEIENDDTAKEYAKRINDSYDRQIDRVVIAVYALVNPNPIYE